MAMRPLLSPEDLWCCRVAAPPGTKGSGIRPAPFLARAAFLGTPLGSYPGENRKLRLRGSLLIPAVRQLGKLFLNKMVS